MARKSGRLVIYGVGAVLLIWVISAAVGALYLISPSDSAARTGQTIALILFAVTTTAIWLGVLVAELVMAWKWSGGRPESPQSRTPRA
jgi:hypothetical protein